MPFAATKQVNPSFVFQVDEEGTCFGTEAFGKIYGETRKDMLQSNQCIQFLNAGGKIFDNPKWEKPNQQGGTPAGQKQSPPVTKAEPFSDILSTILGFHQKHFHQWKRS